MSRLLFLFILCGPVVQAQYFTLDQKDNQLIWTGKAAFSTYSLSGTLEAQDGYMHIRNDSLIRGRVTIDMQSLHSDIKRLKKHLKSADFFEVANYPEAVFEIETEQACTSAEPRKVLGQLTIKGQTHPQVVEITCYRNKETWRLKGHAELDRTDYGVNHHSPSLFSNLGDQAIADTFDLDFDLKWEEKK